jgi:hypothetical protein
VAWLFSTTSKVRELAMAKLSADASLAGTKQESPSIFALMPSASGTDDAMNVDTNCLPPFVDVLQQQVQRIQFQLPLKQLILVVLHLTLDGYSSSKQDDPSEAAALTLLVADMR